MLSTSQAKQFIEDNRHALDHLFEALSKYGVVLESAQRTVEEIKESETQLSDLFMYRDQWSPNANHHYAEYVRRMMESEIEKTEAAKPYEVRLDNALKSIGASVDSMSSLAGGGTSDCKTTFISPV